MVAMRSGQNIKLVAPLAGAWIEMFVTTSSPFTLATSHPSRVRGLK